ncbi:hypothetical protein ACLMJK_000454 [Lecanora helva]
MVVFLDLDEDDVSDSDPHIDPTSPAEYKRQGRLSKSPAVNVNGHNVEEEKNERINPNVNSLTAAFGCYPIITQITAYIDLNTLHFLSLTCQQIRYNLLQYRQRLIRQTLRCENEARNASLTSLKPTGQVWHIQGEEGHLVSGKVSQCARDLVDGCRKCGKVVCRNCTSKPPPLSRLPARHRRLCPSCLVAPLSAITHHNAPSRTPCTCTSTIHLCTPCGVSLTQSDTTYNRIWTWRTRYSTYLGGLGTGIGEGNEGVKCARGKECLGAKDVEVEFDCSSSSSGGSGINGSESGTEGNGSESPMVEKEEAGYWRQEIEGLGGIVKKKYRKRERVGATVKEWEDEREGGEVLGREKRGDERSWCGWCGRVVLGGRDLDGIDNERS